MMTRADISELTGKTLAGVTRSGDEEIWFEARSGERYVMRHHQDCCESVRIDDVAGDLNDLIGSPILLAEEVTSEKNPEGVPVPNYQESFLWTFYKLATIKGSVTIRWYGESNGYYSESVDFELVGKTQ